MDEAKGPARRPKAPSRPAPHPSRAPVGIAIRHSRRCRSRAGGACSCKQTYQAQAWSARDRTPLRKTFGTLAEARAWRAEAQVKLRRGRLSAPTRTLLREAAEEWLAAARTGVARTRSGETYKPSAIRSYEAALRKSVLPELGALRLSALPRNRVQDLVERMLAAGYAPSTVTNAVLPRRVIYRRATEREEVALNPTVGLSLPADRRRRDRVARPAEAEALLGALPERYMALWATALYAGLRRGELQALCWSAVDQVLSSTETTSGLWSRWSPVRVRSLALSAKPELPVVEGLVVATGLAAQAGTGREPGWDRDFRNHGQHQAGRHLARVGQDHTGRTGGLGLVEGPYRLVARSEPTA